MGSSSRAIHANAPLPLLEFVAGYASDPTIRDTWAQPTSTTEITGITGLLGVVIGGSRPRVTRLPDLGGHRPTLSHSAWHRVAVAVDVGLHADVIQYVWQFETACHYSSCCRLAGAPHPSRPNVDTQPETLRPPGITARGWSNRAVSTGGRGRR
jgi:hypothetical protein